MKIILTSIFALLLLSSCSNQQARKPVSQTNSTFIKESIERNKKLVATEEALIKNLIKNDTAHEYLASNKGYWYKYITKSDTLLPVPKRGDVAYFDMEIKDLEHNTIYTKNELKPQEYYVDKEQVIIGLRDGVKLMRKGETVTFIFPSNMAYGYHGDDKKIGPNEPLIYTVTLNDFKPDTNSNN